MCRGTRAARLQAHSVLTSLPPHVVIRHCRPAPALGSRSRTGVATGDASRLLVTRRCIREPNDEAPGVWDRARPGFADLREAASTGSSSSKNRRRKSRRLQQSRLGLGRSLHRPDTQVAEFLVLGGSITQRHAANRCQRIQSSSPSLSSRERERRPRSWEVHLDPGSVWPEDVAPLNRPTC